MKLNPREVRLGLIALIAILAGLTYWLGEPRYRDWQEGQQELELLQRRRDLAQRMLDQTDDLESRLTELRDALPSYPSGTDVTSQILRNLQSTADENNLTLIRREPEPERQIGDLYELAITTSWEGELDALVRFLYALHARGATVDIRQLTISPVQRSPERLRGNLTVGYAYSREGDNV